MKLYSFLITATLLGSTFLASAEDNQLNPKMLKVKKEMLLPSNGGEASVKLQEIAPPPSSEMKRLKRLRMSKLRKQKKVRRLKKAQSETKITENYLLRAIVVDGRYSLLTCKSSVDEEDAITFWIHADVSALAALNQFHDKKSNYVAMLFVTPLTMKQFKMSDEGKTFRIPRKFRQGTPHDNQLKIVSKESKTPDVRRFVRAFKKHLAENIDDLSQRKRQREVNQLERSKKPKKTPVIRYWRAE